jgi:hypothetical protein
MRMTATIRKRARTEMEMARAYHVDKIVRVRGSLNLVGKVRTTELRDSKG